MLTMQEKVDRSIHLVPYVAKETSHLQTFAKSHPLFCKGIITLTMLNTAYLTKKASSIQSGEYKYIKKVVCILSGLLATGALIRAYWKTKDLEYKAELERKAEKFKTDVAGKKRPPETPIHLKSDTRSFNHIFDFAIEDGVVWYRYRFEPTVVSCDNGNREIKREETDQHNQEKPKKIDNARDWKPLFFEGVPKKISADGANLIVIDDKNRVFYRKILLEARGYDEINSDKITRHIKEGSALEKKIGNADKHMYVAVDKIKKINWKESWYNFPVLCRIFNLFTGKALYLHSPNAVVSHRCRYADGYEDPKGRFHEANTGVTHIYELNQTGTEINIHDPWSPQLADVRIKFPKKFYATRIDASASTIMAIGYESVGGIYKRAIYTRLFDIDIDGHDPFLSYAYETQLDEIWDDHTKILHNCILKEGWTEHSLPPNFTACNNEITILQTGRGNAARELRVSYISNNQLFIYSKQINELNWKLVHVERGICQNISQSPQVELEDKRTFKAIIFNRSMQGINVNLKNFGDNLYHSVIEVKLSDGLTIKLGLHKRLGLGTFLGFSHSNYYLVIPKNVSNTQLNQFFEGRKVHHVNIHYNGNTPIITW